MDKNSLKVTFYGGVGKVTGANFMLEKAPQSEAGGGMGQKPFRILVDCGLLQGDSKDDAWNYEPFPYDPHSVDALFITHAHIDHIGRVPKLVRDGFRGTIYSTAETLALAPLMLEDALGIAIHNAANLAARPDVNRVAKTPHPPLYEKHDLELALSLWKSIPYHKPMHVGAGIEVYLRDAGHILGSAMCEFRYSSNASLVPGSSALDRKILFTGDLGNSPTPLLRDTEIASDVDYIVMESVYGDRNHEPQENRRGVLRDVMKKTMERKGTLLIPIFSLEKAQVLLHEINELVEAGEVPAAPIFLDSPLAIKITKVYEKMTENMNDAVKKEIAGGDDIFDFAGLRMMLTREDSMAIGNTPGPKVIIAGSGMSHGGRIMQHERHYLSNANNAILFVGYQGAGTIGRQIQDGATTVNIMDEDVSVRAEITTISGYSSHKDSDHLVEFVHECSSEHLKKVFVVMGEDKSSLFLVQKLRDELGVKAFHPEAGESAMLE